MFRFERKGARVQRREEEMGTADPGQQTVTVVWEPFIPFSFALERVFRKFLQMLGMKWVSPIQVGFRSGLDELEFITDLKKE